MLVEEIYKLDRGVCHICQKHIKLEEVTLDHIIPQSAKVDGLHDEYWNLKIAHKLCNTKRGAGKIAGQIRLPIPLTFTIERNNCDTDNWRLHFERMEKVKAMKTKNDTEFWEEYKKLQYPGRWPL